MITTKERISDIYDEITKEDAIVQHYKEYFKEFDFESKQFLEDAIKQVILQKILKSRLEKKNCCRLLIKIKSLLINR